jgi:hypothetical protein
MWESGCALICGIFFLYFPGGAQLLEGKQCSVEWEDDTRTWTICCKGLGRRQSYPNRGTIPSFDWRNWGKPWIFSVIVAGVPALIRTERLPNAVFKLHYYANPFSERKVGRRVEAPCVLTFGRWPSSHSGCSYPSSSAMIPALWAPESFWIQWRRNVFNRPTGSKAPAEQFVIRHFTSRTLTAQYTNNRPID